MKKWLLISVSVLMMVFGATYVFAATPDSQSPAVGGFNVDQMIDACKQAVGNFVNDGTITSEQGKTMNEQMNTMAPVMRGMMGGNGQNMPGSGMMGNNTNPVGQGMVGQGTANQGMPCYDNTKSN